jgi:peptidyl-prolyl cis-trans isomerase D
MPFEVFRRHQRKLLAIFAMLAMFGFVVSDSLPKLLNPSFAGRDQPVVTLYGKTVYRSALNAMREQRTLANMFVAELLAPYLGRTQFFGGTKDRDLVDALILQHEADRLGIPAGSEQGRFFLKRITGDKMTTSLFEGLMTGLNNRVSGDQLLVDLANQVRLANVRTMLGSPLVTPYDVFRSYREQSERVAAKVVEIPVERFLAQVPEPSPEEIEAEYEKYMNVLPDPARPTPGFQVPRQIQVEILSIDGNALARGIQDKLTEAELRVAYENRKSEFPLRSELPADLFAGKPELTPPILRPFAEVRTTLAVTLGEEKAQAEIVEKFTRIKDEVLIPFADEYSTAVIELEEAKNQNPKAIKPLPTPSDLKELAERERLNYEITKPLAREEADHYGAISEAEVGTTRLSGGRKFAPEFFDPKKALYEPEVLTDVLGMRFLARKIKDVGPHVPPLGEVRSDVSLACKLRAARAFAAKSARELAEQLKKKGGAIKDTTAEGYRVLAIPPIARRQSALLRSQSELGLPEPSVIPDVAYPGESFRDAYFSLQPGEFSVAANQPETIYYVMALDRREPATFAALYAPNGDEYGYKMLTRDHAARQLEDAWMGWLRNQAGLDPGWLPPDEAKGQSSADDA